MLTKEQTASLLGVLGTASITAIGFAIGGTIGASVMASIGINLSSTIIQEGSLKLKEQWLTSDDGIINHDIQQALARAFIKALTDLEREYFNLGQADALPNDAKESIKELFKELKQQARQDFPSTLEQASKEHEITDYLYTTPEAASDKLWQQINGADLLSTYHEHFRSFLRKNLLNEVQFWFGEELKTDNKECNRAWRAFQRLLLEGIRADVQAVQANQDLIRQDLQTLEALRNQIALLSTTIDHRLPNEPFQQGLEKAVNQMQAVLAGIAETTLRTEKKVESIAADVKKLLPSEIEELTPPIPDDIKKLCDEGQDLCDAGKYEDARIKFQEALELSIERGHAIAEANARFSLATISYMWDKNPSSAKFLYQDCLRVFQSSNYQKGIASTLFYLGSIELQAGNLDQAEAYISQSLDIEKRIGKKLGIAHALHQLGWIEDHRGRSKEAIDLYNQALTNFLSVYHENNAETEKEAVHGIAACYHHKGLVFQHEGKPEDAGTNFMRALEWYRKSGVQINIGRILFILAKFNYAQNQYERGTQFLDEATGIYQQMGDLTLYAQCLDLKGRLHFTRGQTDKATALFESALNAVETSGDYQAMETYLNKLGHAYSEAKKLEEAKQYFERARELCLRENLLEGYEKAVEGLARIAHIENNPEERDRLLLDGVETLEKLLLSVQAEPRRAYIMGRIGFFYEKMEKFEQALMHYQREKKAYESLGDIGSIANSMGSIARMHGFLKRPGEEFDTYRELKKLVDGSGYHDLIAGTAINLGVLQMRSGNLDEAKLMFREAELLCQQYNLVEYQQHLKNNIKRLAEHINQTKPPQLSFEQLIAELFELTEWFPEAKDSIFRLWMWGRKDDLVANYRNTTDIKFMVCQDEVDTFLKVSRILHPYTSLCLQAVSSEYPSTGIDMIPFPLDKPMFFEVSRGIGTKYTITASTARSKITGNEGVVIIGLTTGLPDQAHQLILSSSAEELIKQKIFFLPYDRQLANDKLTNDLQLSKEFDFIPIYFDSLPDSEGAEVITSKTINLPILTPDEAGHLRRQIRKVKQSLYQLSAANKETVRTSLSDFIFEVEELNDSCMGKSSIQVQVHILSFPSALERELHLALVILNSPDTT